MLNTKRERICEISVSDDNDKQHCYDYDNKNKSDTINENICHVDVLLLYISISPTKSYHTNVKYYLYINAQSVCGRGKRPISIGLR